MSAPKENSRNVNKNLVLLEQEPQLTASQNQALSLLLAGNSGVLTAQEIGVTAETISRWLNHDSHFIAAYRRGLIAQHQAVENSIVELAQDAVATIAEIMRDKKQEPKIRLDACRLILSARAAPDSYGKVSPGQVSSEIKARLKPPRFEIDL